MPIPIRFWRASAVALALASVLALAQRSERTARAGSSFAPGAVSSAQAPPPAYNPRNRRNFVYRQTSGGSGVIEYVDADLASAKETGRAADAALASGIIPSGLVTDVESALQKLPGVPWSPGTLQFQLANDKRALALRLAAARALGKLADRRTGEEPPSEITVTTADVARVPDEAITRARAALSAKHGPDDLLSLIALGSSISSSIAGGPGSAQGSVLNELRARVAALRAAALLVHGKASSHVTDDEVLDFTRTVFARGRRAKAPPAEREKTLHQLIQIEQTASSVDAFRTPAGQALVQSVAREAAALQMADAIHTAGWDRITPETAFARMHENAAALVNEGGLPENPIQRAQLQALAAPLDQKADARAAQLSADAACADRRGAPGAGLPKQREAVQVLEGAYGQASAKVAIQLSSLSQSLTAAHQPKEALAALDRAL
jgi:hypothetical protein